MKIALIVYQFIKEKGGVEGYVFNLSSQLLMHGHEVHIFTHRFRQDEDRRLIFHHVPAITFWSPLKYWTFAINAPKIVKKTGIQFDIVHGLTQTLFQDIYRVGGGCHWEYMIHTYPLMQSVPGRIIMCLNPNHFSLLLLERIIFKGKRYKQITCNSEQCKREIVKHYKLPANDIEIIYNGVDIAAFTEQNRQQHRDVTRKRYAVKEDEVLLLFVGSGFKRKGVRHVIEALSLINGDKKVKLFVAGKGQIQKYKILAKEKGVSDKIIFAGLCKNIHEIYAAGDIFVFPSEYDAFGNACLEAMASGLPIIVSRTSGVSEIINHGTDGFVINHPVDADEIAGYITVLLEKEKRGQIGAAARKKSEIFSLEANVTKTLDIYQKIVNIHC